MDNNRNNDNANASVYFLNARIIDGSETNPYSSVPHVQSSLGSQVPVSLASSSTGGGQYAASLPHQVNGSRQHTHEVLNEHRTNCACTGLPNTQNSIGEVPVRLTVTNHSGQYATLPQPVQNFAGNIPAMFNVGRGQLFQIGRDPTSMMSNVGHDGVGGWYPPMHVVRTRMKESDFRNMLHGPIVPEREEVVEAPPPSKPANTEQNSGKKKKKSVEEEEPESNNDGEGTFSDEEIKRFHRVAIVLCLFSMFTVAGAAANLIIYIIFQYNHQFNCFSLLRASSTFLFQTDTSPYVGIEYGIGILAILVFSTGILTYHIEDPLKTTSVSVLGFISAIVALVICLSEATTFASQLLLLVQSSEGHGGSSSLNPCLMTLIISPFISVFGLIEFLVSIILFVYLMVKRCQALKTKTAKPPQKKTVRKSTRDVVSAANTKGNWKSYEKDTKHNKVDDSEEEDEDASEDEDEENWRSDETESTEESETEKSTSKQIKRSKMRDDSNDARTKHPSTPPVSSRPPLVRRPEIPCAPLGSIYAGYAAYPSNQAMLANGYVWGGYQQFQFGERAAAFSSTKY